MITALVQFHLPDPIRRDKAKQVFLSTAPRYLEAQGLIRKYYILSEDGRTAGGVYLWRSQEDAERMYSQEWKEFVFQKYGSQPTVTFFHSPVVVDNLIKEIIEDGSGQAEF
jgi:hypothetical protein